MSQQSKATLETYFQTGDIPTQPQFKDLLDSIPIYKRYSALISQVGVAAPTVKILENTIGAVVWSYVGVGDYLATLAGAFTTDKTFILIGKNFTLSAAAITPKDVICDRVDANSIYLDTATPLALADSLLVDTPIEIRIYY